MTGEPTRAQLENENELICSILLGLKQLRAHRPPTPSSPDGVPAVWTNGRTSFETPLFAAWVGVSMILDAYAALELEFSIYFNAPGSESAGWHVEIPEVDVLSGPHEKGPDAVRASAVAVVTKYREERHGQRKIQDQMHHVPKDSGSH